MNKRLAEIRNRKMEIRSLLSGSANVDLQALKDELDKLEIEERSIEERQEIANKIVVKEVETRTIVGKEDDRVENFGADSKEYRSAFFKSLKGEDLTEVEKRALTFTTSTAGAVIPTETLNKIYEKLEQDSVLYPLVQHYSIAGNLGIGVETTDSEASWTAEATAGTDSNGKIDNVVLLFLHVCFTLWTLTSLTTETISFLLYIVFKIFVASLKTSVYIFYGVCPDTIFELILPAVTAGCNYIIIFI